MCLILLVPVKFPDLTLAPEVTPPRNPFESKQNSPIASMQFVLPNQVIALELTAIIYVPLCAVLNLDRPAAFLHGCQQKSAHSQEITNLQVSLACLSHLTGVLGQGCWGIVVSLFPSSRKLTLMWASFPPQKYRVPVCSTGLCLVHTSQLRNIQKPFH